MTSARSDPVDARSPASGSALHAHLGGLATIAFAQPLFEQLASRPAFFAARGSSIADVLLLVAMALLLPPLPWLAAAWAARRWLRHRPAVVAAAALVGSLVAVVALRAASLAELSPLTAVAAAGSVGMAAAAAYRHTAVARQVASWLAAGSLVVPAVFLLDPDVQRTLTRHHLVIERHPTGAKVPVVLIVLDELPLAALLDATGELDARRVPRLAAFAREATWFSGAVAASWETATAVPALLSGRIALPGDRGQKERNLCTLLGDYPAYVVGSYHHVCPPERNLLAPRHRPPLGERVRLLARDLPAIVAQLIAPPAWRHHLPPIAAAWEGFRGESDGVGSDTPPEAERPGPYGRRRGLALFRQSIKPAERVLLVGHLLFPHSPWDHLPSGRSYPSEPDRFVPEEMPPERWRAALLYQRFLLQVGYTDGLVGDILDRLRAAGLYERSLVIVVADHGVSFEPGGQRREITPATLADVLSVPLLVKRPGQRQSERVDHAVSAADILPTIADELALTLPWPVDGTSLFARAGSRPARYLDQEGRLHTAPPDLHIRTLAARDRLRELGGDPGADDPFLIGPHPQLHGRPVATLLEAAQSPSEVSVVIDHPERYARVDATAAVVPLFVGGRLTGTRPGDGCCELAVAFGDTVWATAGSFRSREGESRFGALVPERALVPGDQRLRVFRIVPGAAGMRLQALPAG